MYETWEFYALGKGYSIWSLLGRAAQVRNTIEAMGGDGNQGIRDTQGCHYYFSIISIYQERRLISITIELCEEEPSLSCKNFEVWRCFEGGTWL